MKTRQIDVAIVGYGIEGRIIALMISSLFEKVIVFDAPHPLNLGADSMRNHSVIHFGMMYGENSKVSALQMAHSGEAMHELVGLSIPNDGGILSLKEEDVSLALNTARNLSLSHKVWQISDREASRQIGPFFAEGRKYLRIPETVFKEKLILEKSDLRARENGVRVQKEKVTLSVHPQDATRCLIHTANEVVESEYVILCAGTGLIGLLSQLGIENNLAVFCTPLMRFPFHGKMRARYFADKSESGLNGAGFFVAHHAENSTNEECLVVAKSIRRTVPISQIEKRIVLAEEERMIRSSIPKSILPNRNDAGYRLIAGHKTESVNSNGISSIASKILECHPYENVIGVIPGKATLAYYAASQVIEWIKIRSKRIPSRKNVVENFVRRKRVSMHYDSIYDGILDDRSFK